MTDLLIRDVPDHVLAALDVRAKRLGLSRSQYLQRALAREVGPEIEVTPGDFDRFAKRFGDLGDADVMRGAWE